MAERKKLSDKEIAEKYKITDKRLIEAIINSRITDPKRLVEFIAAWVAINQQKLAAANKQFDTYLKGVADINTAPIRDIRQDAFIELNEKMKFASDYLIKRMDKDIKKLGKYPHINTVKEALIQDFNSNGVYTIEYANGTKRSLAAHAQMVTRTARTETNNRNALEAAKRNGSNLVYIPSIGSTCPICAKYEGRVYCIDGKDNRYPPLYGDNAPFSNGYDCLHPNCRHHIVPYYEDKEEPKDVEKMLKESNKPFRDDRTTAEVKQYQKGQARNRQVYEKLQKKLKKESEKLAEAEK